MKIRETIGARIFRLREAAGLNQAELAKKVGKDQSYLSRVERGVFVPTEMSLDKLALALGKKPEELTQGTINIDPKAVVLCPNKMCPGEMDEYPHPFGKFTVGDEDSVKPFRRNRGSREYVRWFCPICGSFLIDRCLNCGRIIEGGFEASNCIACGEPLISSDGLVPPPKELIADEDSSNL